MQPIKATKGIANVLHAWAIQDQFGHDQGMVHARWSNGKWRVDVYDTQKMTFQGSGSTINSALAGAQIAGITMTDDAVKSKAAERWLHNYLNGEVGGYESRNKFWAQQAQWNGLLLTNLKDGQFTACYEIGGLEKLTAMRYKIIQVL